MTIFHRQRDDHKPDWASSTWLAWPTLSCGGGGQIKAAGVYYHKQALRDVISHAGTLVMAELRIELEGEYAGALRVCVSGVEVGSIPHGLSEEFRDAVEQLHKLRQPATCRAQLEADLVDDEAYVDVWLSAGPHPRSEDDPFLPPGSGTEVQLYHGQAERLNDSMRSRAKSKRAIEIGQLTPGNPGWLVVLHGETIGSLPAGRYSRLDQARSAGFPLTCRIRLVRAPDKPLRVNADFPSD